MDGEFPSKNPADKESDPEACGSRIPGFYRFTLEQRRQELLRRVHLVPEELELLKQGSLPAEAADHIVENVIGTYTLPLGLGLNFQINGRDHLVPMCVEEPSVIAAASNAARMVRAGGGFWAEADPPLMIAQVQLVEVPDTTAAGAAILAEKDSLLLSCDAVQPGLLRRGGGARDLEVRVLEPSEPLAGRPGMMVVHIIADCRDAMGANLVNTMAEAVAEQLATLSRGQFGLRILSNLADRRLVRVSCKVPPETLGTGGFNGAAVRDGIISASRFAELDPYRAATHNKGILNGIDPVVIATGNDWRGVEAGAHAFAARSGVYRPLAVWRGEPDGCLSGRLELPMAVGTAGGTLRVHPGARLSLRIIGVKNASELGMVIASAGLASNLAALRALATEGIQRGHMSLHARSVAVAAGARGELVDRVAAELAALGDIRADRAAEILARLQTT
jgi:hydroxymethylglutaryl-CoA reductase